MFELANETLFFVIAFGQSSASRLHTKQPYLPFGPTRGNQIVHGMPSHADQRIAHLVDVVDQVTCRNIDQLRRLVTANGCQSLAIVGECGSEDPVEMIVTAHHFNTVSDVEDSHQLVRATDGNESIVMRNRDSVKRIRRSFDRTNEFSLCSIPDLDLAKFGCSATASDQQAPIARKRERLEPRGITEQPCDNARTIGPVQQNLMPCRHGQQIAVGRKRKGTNRGG